MTYVQSQPDCFSLWWIMLNYCTGGKIVLCVLPRFTDSDYTFGISKLFANMKVMCTCTCIR
jgi:hypothetical protein